MSTAGITAEEMFESLTGFDEMAISKHFGDEWQDLAQRKPVQFLRALAFIQYKRTGPGQNDRQARDQAMGLTVRQAQEFFEPDAEDFDPDNPDSESGKD